MKRALTFLFLISAASLWPLAASQASNPFNSIVTRKSNTDTVQTSPLDLHLADVGTVTSIIKSDTIKLSSGKIYKLDNIRIPLQVDKETTKLLTEMLLNKKVGIYISGEDPSARADRFGHILGHIVLENGEWAQEALVSSGLAWVTGSAKSRDLVFPLYKHEDLARSQSLGLWAYPELALKDNTTIHNNTYNSFQVYQGKIVNISMRGKYVYFNFGENPQEDFTVSFNKETMEPFKLRNGTRKYNPSEFIGMNIRIRGWVEENGGPMMTLEFQEQLEFPDFAVSPLIFIH